ncbi:cell surface glycoprotein MUC18 isoform X1 [Silurus asotus]|uniref:Cell surface glycoprotein MUC18 isoform X1 n=1 Tax=Silurus asotus TaxID=30991 RepID=A0AAD5FM53_SILAS|nr:cell surface glycoprotein MUC18 isoform X1 [Silurus asotus]
MEDRVEVLLGEVAEIPCLYNLKVSSSLPTIQWFVKSAGGNKVRIYHRDNNEEIVDQGTGFSGRINISHSWEMQGNSVLIINPVRVDDEREFICQVNVDGVSDEGLTRLLVFNNPSFPVIEAGQYASISEPLNKIGSCEVSNGYPAPKITWYKERTPLYASPQNVDIQNRVTFNSNGLHTVHSELYLTVEKKDKDAYFYCEVTYFLPGAEKMIESKHINITILYPTSEVTMFLDPPELLVKEGDNIEIICQGDGNPQPVKSFTHNNEAIDTDLDKLVLSNVTRKNSGIYECSCLDTTTFDSITGNLTLMVHFLDPVVITPENPYSLDEGEDLNLTCNAMSSLPTQTFWYKDNVRLEEGHELRLDNASFATAGDYVCEVFAPELPALRKHGIVHVRVRGKPMITEGVAVIPLDSETAINVSCSAAGHPTPTIDWSLSDKQAQLGRWDTSRDNSVHSIISISTTSDITASCRATNDLGTAERSRTIQAIQMNQATTTTTTTPTTTTNTTIITTTTTTTSTTSNTTGMMGGNGFIIAIIIIFILLLAILGSVLYFMYKKGKIPCGRSGKKDLTKEKVSNDDIVVEMKSSKSEEAVLLQGVNGDKKTSSDQFEKQEFIEGNKKMIRSEIQNIELVILPNPLPAPGFNMRST